MKFTKFITAIIRPFSPSGGRCWMKTWMGMAKKPAEMPSSVRTTQASVKTEQMGAAGQRDRKYRQADYNPHHTDSHDPKIGSSMT